MNLEVLQKDEAAPLFLWKIIWEKNNIGRRIIKVL